MAMKARVRTNALGDITIHMEGDLDFENNSPLKEELEDLSQENPTSLITIDMHGINFIGSSGIGMFVETINSLNKKKEQIKITNASTEFLKVFRLYDKDFMSFIIDQFENDDTEFLSQKFSGKQRTFQN